MQSMDGTNKHCREKDVGACPGSYSRNFPACAAAVCYARRALESGLRPLQIQRCTAFNTAGLWAWSLDSRWIYCMVTSGFHVQMAWTCRVWNIEQRSGRLNGLSDALPLPDDPWTSCAP